MLFLASQTRSERCVRLSNALRCPVPRLPAIVHNLFSLVHGCVGVWGIFFLFCFHHQYIICFRSARHCAVQFHFFNSMLGTENQRASLCMFLHEPFPQTTGELTVIYFQPNETCGNNTWCTRFRKIKKKASKTGGPSCLKPTCRAPLHSL